jgi:16S rRNA (cytosine967-C5)-methyltransferase
LTPAPSARHGLFDAILLDVPCSNTGVLRRRVDARWRLQPRDLCDLPLVQEKILENALACLKDGGRIVYSTCSIEPEENIELVKRFVSGHPELTLTSHQQILPHQDQTDGAFCALLQKT